MKQTWKCINSLISNKKTISKTVTIIKNPNSSSTTSEPTEVTNVLNKHFATVGQNLSSKFSSTNNSFSSFLKNSIRESFFFMM